MMHMINTAYAMYIKKKYDWTGHVFQSRYHALQVGELPYFKTVIQYIKENPVKAEYCKSCSEYPWFFINEKIVNKITQAYQFIR